MAKRSKFPRIPRDLYRTWDPKAIVPLLAHLPAGARYGEPCAGGADLINLLAPHASCVWASDIKPLAPGIETLDMMACALGDADMFVTNPPWTRKLLHPLILHLSDQAPTWLLFDADWAHTKQARPFMPRCRKIVSVGRLKWIPDSKHQGKDNAAWYLFDRPIPGSRPVFYDFEWTPTDAGRVTRVCHDCTVMIDRFGKWSLQMRNGVLTPVHKNCDDPSGLAALGLRPLAAAPLLDWIARPAEENA